MRWLSLFSGIGGFELGIQRAYESNNEHAYIGTESEQEECEQGRERAIDKLQPFIHAGNGTAPLCVGFSEIDKHAIAIYQKRFPKHKNYGDITKIEAEKLPEFDLLAGGFPCQSFSIAGKRRGFADTRGTLFFDIARIIKAKQPRLLLLENVKGLLSHDKGDTFRTIIATLDELGYDVQWQVLNSKVYIPQNRERVYIVGHLRGTPRPEVFPLYSHDIEDSRIQGHACNTITARYEGAQAVGTYVVESELHEKGIQQLNKPVHSNDRIYAPDGIGPTLNTMQGGNRQPFIALGGNGTSESKEIDAGGMREVARLPERLDRVGTSDSQRYKCCGNAVTTYCVQAIAEKLFL